MKLKKTKTKYIRLAFDGYSASGKSLAAKLISKKYKLHLLNSGLLYRYAAFLIIKNKPKNKISFLKKKFKNLSYKIVTRMNLHNEEISSYASIIAKQKKVRDILKEFQKKFAKKYKKIAIEGRDIASKIMPNADLKIFFKCSVKEKAKRRLQEFKKINKKVTLKEVEKSLKTRDFNDKNRKESPLLFTKGAVLVDTTNLNLQQMRSKLKKLVQGEIKKKNGSL